MFKIIKFIKTTVLLGKRLEAEKEEQKKEGYEVEHVFRGYENYLIYREGERELTAQVEAVSDFTREFKLFTNSYLTWNKPRGEKVTPFDHQKVTNRFVKYLSCWGGETILDGVPFQSLEEIKESLRTDDIEFVEHDGFVYYEMDADDERKRKDSILNQTK